MRPVRGQLTGHSLLGLIGGQGFDPINDGFPPAVHAGSARGLRCPCPDRVCRSSGPDYNLAARRTALRLDVRRRHGLQLLHALVRRLRHLLLPLFERTCCVRAEIPPPHSWAARHRIHHSQKSGIDLVLPLLLAAERMTCPLADVLHGPYVSAQTGSECGEGTAPCRLGSTGGVLTVGMSGTRLRS